MPARNTIYLSKYIDKYAAASPATAATKKGLFKYFLSRNNHILKLLFNNFIVHVKNTVKTNNITIHKIRITIYKDFDTINSIKPCK